ncbi:MAG: hypothetical protein WBK77_03455 [Alphaproteobacteria bacterium]
MLGNKELAAVANKLEVPVIISDILSGEDKLTDEVHYGLHSVISDQQPDTALLSIALAGLKIANAWHKASPGLAVLKMECENIVDEYAALWLKNAENKNLSDSDILDALSCVSEDLECLGELLELAMGFLKSKDETCAALAKILSIQAKSHAMIADELFSALYTEMAQIPDIAPAIADQAMTNNVIPFRSRRPA